MTMHKALHPRDDVNRLYISRKDGGRGLARIEESVDASIQRLEDYIKKTRRTTDDRHQKWYWQHGEQQNDNNQETEMGRKELRVRFKWLINDISREKTLTCLRKGNFKRETESLQKAAKTTP